jgi:hypothetical protein
VRDQVVTVGGPDTMTVAEAWKAACEATGVTASTWPVPPGALRAASVLARPLGRRWQNHLQALDAWFSHDSAVDRAEMEARFGLPLTPYRDAVKAAWLDRHPSEDPLAREEKVVHRQFVATIYEPGTVPLASLPDGPPPRRD